MKLRKTQVQIQNGKKRPSLQLEKMQKPCGVGEGDQSVGYIVCVANIVKLYQKKNQNCFGCGSPDHLVKECLKDLSNTTQKVSLNAKEGMMKKGGSAPQKPVVAQLASPDESPRA